MKPTHTSTFFDRPNGILEIRCSCMTHSVTGHWKAFDGRYHNTALLVVDEQFQRDRIRELLRHALGEFTVRDITTVITAIVKLPGVWAL